jgi:hypothetical protein
MHYSKNLAIAFAALSVLAVSALAQGSWTVDIRGAAGPIAQVSLKDSSTKHRTSFIAFEYAKKCDPVFSFIEIAGQRLGNPIGQSVLTGTKIGVVVDGKFHTSHAATTKYDNGYEAGFGVTNELFESLKGKVSSLSYVTPDGERISIPTSGFTQAVQSAFDICARRFK